jgi:hypothetical protein
MTAADTPGTPDRGKPVLVFLVGPPAVGKMAVGHELAARTGLRLFHNHLTIELVLRFFPFGSPPFGRLVGEFRRRIFEEVAASELPGLIFTYVWAFNDPSDATSVESYAAIFRNRGSTVCFVELEATQEERPAPERDRVPARREALETGPRSFSPAASGR